MALAIEAWNLLGGYDIGPALDRVVDMLGIVDIDLLIVQLKAIRDKQ